MKYLSYPFLLIITFCVLQGNVDAKNDKKFQRKRIGICTVATGKYDQFLPALVESARKHFCTNHEVTFFVFTDGQVPEGLDIVRIEQKRLGWPYDTLKRFEIYNENRKYLQNMDYIFAIDADMLFVSKIGNEIFSDLVGIRHPGFISKRGSYETNPASRACVKQNEGKYYYCGGVWGGIKKEFFKLCAKVVSNINSDLEKNFIAVWHDESHLNRYFIDHPPTKTLSPSYCYPESWQLKYKKKIVALDKNHAEVRKGLISIK